jgi:hypothetical protein
MKQKCNCLKIILQIIILFFIVHNSIAQENTDSMQGRNIYRPGSIRTDTANSDTVVSTSTRQINSDSIAARLAFIQDSILAREKFVRDSIQRRKEILDSLNFLKTSLPGLIDASLKTFTDQIIVNIIKPEIVGDSTLSDYKWVSLPFSMDQPYIPWKSAFNLSYKPIKFKVDTINKRITSIETSLFNSSFSYTRGSKFIRIDEQGSITSNKRGQFYKVPIDTVFFDARGRLTGIKRYLQIYQSVNYKKGAFIVSYLYQVKQYEYGNTEQFTSYKIVNFCERWANMDPSKVCSIINFTLSNQGKNIILTRNNDPANVYSDGIFNFEFEGDYTLKSVSFNNQSKSEDWKIFVELNDVGNVSRYVYQTKGFVHRTLLINYFLDDPKAKNKVETITCTFEDDGISYYQVNNTTGKSRTRDKFTGEWGPWK